MRVIPRMDGWRVKSLADWVPLVFSLDGSNDTDIEHGQGDIYKGYMVISDIWLTDGIERCVMSWWEVMMIPRRSGAGGVETDERPDAASSWRSLGMTWKLLTSLPNADLLEQRLRLSRKSEFKVQMSTMNNGYGVSIKSTGDSRFLHRSIKWLLYQQLPAQVTLFLIIQAGLGNYMWCIETHSKITIVQSPMHDRSKWDEKRYRFYHINCPLRVSTTIISFDSCTNS